jgi:hypothetical protein
MGQLAAFFDAVTLGEVILAIMACGFIHKGMVAFLPDRIAGPGGWLIDTASRD